MEFNGLIEKNNWLELHTTLPFDLVGYKVIARFNTTLVNRGQVIVITKLLGYQLSATPDKFSDV